MGVDVSGASREGVSFRKAESVLCSALALRSVLSILFVPICAKSVESRVFKKKKLVAEVVRAEQQALSGVGSTFNPMADKTTVIGQAPIVATSKDNTTNLTKQQATEIISQDADGKLGKKNLKSQRVSSADNKLS